jgi:transcriptional regulator with XRE-family HTH domain
MEVRDITGMGRRIAGKRTECGLSQEELAQKAGKSRSTISKIEGGEREDVPILTLLKIATALSVSLHYLVYGYDEPHAMP